MILIVIPSFYPAIIYGGPVFTSYNTCNELVKLGVKFRVLSTNANGVSKLKVLPNKFSILNGYSIKYYNETIIGKFSLSLFLNVKNDIRNSDLIHIQGIFSTPTPIALYWAKKYNKRILLTPHGTLGNWSLNQKSSIKKVWLAILIRPYAKYISWHATSYQEKKDIEKNFPGANVTVITNGTYLEEFSKFNKIDKGPFLKKFTDHSKSVKHIIISAGRLQKVKGFDILIKSFYEVLKNFPNSVLLIAGQDEGELDNLQKLISVLKLNDRVFFTGLISGQDKVDYFANADVFALSSHTENFGVVYAEALAAGTPIVASTNTPWQEVDEAGCGRWVPNTVEDTAEAIIDLLSRDRETLRQNALKYVQKFDWKNIALDFKKLYESMV